MPQIQQTNYVCGIGMVIHENKWKFVSKKKKGASGSLKKSLRNNKKYTPARFFKHSVYSKRDEKIKRWFTNNAIKAEHSRTGHKLSCNTILASCSQA